MTTADPRRPILGSWGRNIVDTTIRGNPCRVFEHRRRSVSELRGDARRWGERTYLIQGDRRISFRAFEDAVITVGARLASRGVKPADRVMLLANNSADWVITFFAVVELGAIVVCGNSWWSEPEIVHALELTTPTVVVADDKRGAKLPVGTSWVGIDDLARAHLSEPPAGMRLSNRPICREDDPAVILFTSGTTGAPKAAVLSHRSVIANQHNLLAATRRLPSELREDHAGPVVLVSLPLFHMGGVQVVLSSLLTGAILVFLEGRFEPGEVLRLIEVEKVRAWGGVPTMISRVLDHPDLMSRDTSSLATITIAGAYVPATLMERVRSAFPTARRSAGTVYGMTESGGALTAVAGADMEDHPGTVGRALPTVDIRISDADRDGIGEIQARSPTVMTSYWQCGDDTILTSDGWLRTGDLGRIDDEGFLYVVGRSKDVVIRGGENIACANVEMALAAHSAVEAIAVVGLPHADYGEEVGAAVVLRPGAQVDEAELRRFAAQRLAYFEVPSRWWLRTDPLPTNATGKIVKSILQATWIDTPPHNPADRPTIGETPGSTSSRGKPVDRGGLGRSSQGGP
jgi:long-chain acyl-CoA synthetase